MAWEIAFQIRGTAPERLGRSHDIEEILQGKQQIPVVEHQEIPAHHTTQTSQVNDFSAFLCLRRCESLGSLKLFLRYAS